MEKFTNITNAFVTPTDPLHPPVGPVSRSGATQDPVILDAHQKGIVTEKGGTFAQVVFKVKAAPGASAKTNPDGSATIEASAGETTQYLKVTLGSPDPDNWDLKVGTSGGSNYMFTKGRV
ncbi:MAG: hypothetical protein ABI432_15915 [Flavobacteriales bacterium]